MASKKIQLYTDRANTIEASPETSASCVILSDGNDLQKVLDNDLTTPTVVHEETSFKVGVGDINVSPSVVDGEASRMVIKGKTYQNILPEPSLRNSMSKGKTMQKFNEGYDNVNVVDGVGKNAILKGQTSVNIHKLVQPNLVAEVPGNFAITKNSIGEISFDIIVSDSTKWRYINAGFLNISLLKPNTKYLVVFEESQNITWVKFMSGNALNAISESGKVQNNRAIVTTLNQITDNNQILYLTFKDDTPNTKVSFKNPMIIEYQDGMENWDIPYFEGMKSVKAPTVKTVGKNLFDKNTAFSGWVDNETGVITKKDIGVGDNIVSDYIKIVSTKTYTMNTSVYQWYYTKDKKYINNPVSVGTNLTPPDNAKYVILAKSISNQNSEFYSILNSMQLEEGSAPTTYEPHKSNTLLTPENVFLRSVENTQDTLNLNTGEHIQRIGEVTLNGNEAWGVLDNNTTDTIGFTLRKVLPLKKTGDKYVRVNCDKLPSYKHNLWNQDKIGCVAENNINQDLNDTQLQVRVLKSSLKTVTTQGFKEWLQANPITIQYILETPIVKTVALSSSGNWEKVVLDGNQNWSESYRGWSNKVFCLNNKHTPNIATQGTTATTLISNDILATNIAWLCEEKGRTGIATHEWAVDYLQIAINGIETTDQLKSHLSQNPITVWYQTATHKDSTQVKQPLSFSNGHIQLSSEEGSLIPSLDYEVPTNNSYHLNLAKTSTQYTMKNMRGTFTVDGNNYNASANGTFTTPNQMTNKLMITSVTQSNAMLLEGDVTSKTLPYFKGIKSAFEGEDKIEILSVGKNLFDKNKIKNMNGVIVTENGIDVDIWYAPTNNPLKLKPNTTYKVSCKVIVTQPPVGTVLDASHRLYLKKENGGIGYIAVYWTDLPSVLNVGDVLNICNNFTTPKNIHDYDELVWYSLHGDTNGKVQITNLQIEESSTPTSYEPHKSNNTKIPLLSPLRSLPNGAYDELIIDRMEKKATLVQRVGVETISNQHNMAMAESKGELARVMVGNNNVKFNSKPLSNRFKTGTANVYHTTEEGVWVGGSPNFHFTLKTSQLTTVDTNGFKKWFSNNSTMVLYELATPIITEIDLEGFPYIYKDGHIFLNSEIAPVVEINCNVNQSQQIQANNETLQRHELDILDLDNLIVSFVNAEYNLRLLKFDMEMSMMALAE